MDEDKIVLDRKSFEALAVDTRVKILKSLKVRRKTLSEIAKEQEMSVSGVKEHLETLEKVGLIEKIDDGHKWKYYELTRKGSDIVAPRELRVWILLSISMIALIASMVAIFTPPSMVYGGEGSALSPPQPMSLNASGKAVAFENTEAAYDSQAAGGVSEENGAPLMASAYPTGAAESNASRDLTIGAAPAAPETPGLEGDEGKAAGGLDMTVPLAVAAISALTLLVCAGVLIRNRMKPQSLG